MLNAVLNYEQDIFIDKQTVVGVNDINIGYDIPESPISGLGKGYRFATINGPQNATVNINRFFVGQDFFYDYTGENDQFSGITREKNSGKTIIAFKDAYLTSHSISSQIGQIPRISTTGIIAGEVGSTINGDFLPDEEESLPDPEIPNQGSVEIICDGHDFKSFNRVTSFNYNINIQRHFIYGLNEEFPIEVKTLPPKNIEGSFSIEIDEHDITDLKEYFSSKEMKDISIKLYDSHEYLSGTKNLIQEYETLGAKLLSHYVRTNASGNLEYFITYQKYENFDE